MKNLKKVLAFVVVFAMMFTFAVSANPFPDVADDASYAEAATILNGIGIMIGDDQGNFNPDKTITRAEAATIIVRAKALGDAAAGAVGATAFTDVPANHWASGFINIATQSGIVAGYGDGTFGPEDPVTYEQMVKLIVAALGYTPKAEANGGYPTGYLVIASQEGITKGATGNAGEPAPRKVVARLVFNALDVDMMEQTGYGTDEKFEKVAGSTLLKLLGIDKYEGVIGGSYATDGKTAKDDKTVTLAYTAKNGNKNDFGEEDFLIGKTDAAGLVGYNVVAYVDEDDVSGDPIIIAVAPKSGKNESIVIDYTQIDKVKVSNTTKKATEVKYYVNASDKTPETIDIAGDALFFYNGKSNSTSLTDAMAFITQDSNDKDAIKPGKVEFVDNNGDDAYDVIFVTEYNASFVVDEINESRGTISDKRSNDVGIDMDDEKVIYAFYKDGAVAAFEDIKEGDVLTLAKSSDEKFITVYITDAVVEGIVAEKTSDVDEYYGIDGDLYRLDINGTYSLGLKVGDEGKFYLNVDNRVVYKEAVSTSAGNYAFLYDADLDTALGGNKMEIRYLTSEGKYENAYLANKISVYCGNVSETAVDPTDYGTKDMIEALYTIAGGKVTNVNRVLFKYQKNSAGDINKIYVAAVKDDDNFSRDTLNGGDYTYKASTNKLDKVFLKNDAIVFSIPKAADIATADEEDFTVSTVKAMFVDDSDYTVYSYDEGDEGYPEVLVVLGAQTEIDVTTRVFVLTSVAKVNNADGQPVKKFYGYQEGKSVSAEESEDGIKYYDAAGNELGTEPTLKAGDAIIFSLDAAGTIDKIQVLMQADKAKQAVVKGFYNVDALDKDGYTENFFGRAIKKNTNNRLVIDINGTEEELPLKGSDYNVYEVNVNKTTAVVNNSSYSAIDANATMKADKSVDWVYVRMYDDAPVDVVVYTYTYVAAE